MGMTTIRKVFEESDLLKMLIGITKLSPYFYQYSLSITKRQSSLISFIIDSLGNPNTMEDALKGLIVSIRVQDYQLFSHCDK